MAREGGAAGKSLVTIESSDIQVRPATVDDVPVILRLIKDLAEYEKLADQVVANEASLRGVLFGARPAAEVILAHAGGEPVGFAVYFHTFSTFLARPGIYLEDLFVVPAWRSRGVGKQLLTRVAEIGVERGCGRMEWSVLDWNEPAIGFYKKLGARPMDEWTVFRLTGERLESVGRKA
jgi:GNAT superfamily N-acetyltransferase